MKRASAPKQTSEERLAFFNALPYDVIVRSSNGRFHLVIPELPIAASGSTITAAYEQLLRRKTEHFDELLSAGAEDEIELPRGAWGGTPRELTAFFGKTAIACAVIGAALIFTAGAVSRKLSSLSVSQLVKRNASTLSIQADKFLASSPEVKEERLKKLRALAVELRPYAAELRKAWEPPAKPAR